jgi:Arc/MetJ family transcription regulator
MCITIHMTTTRTNIFLDDKLIREAARLSGLETKKDVVQEALRYYVEHRSRPSLLELKGKIRFSDNFDYKATRRAQ